MSKRFLSLCPLILAAGLAACDSEVAAPLDDGPAFAAHAGKQIVMLDNCDPGTFPPGACTGRSGGMSFPTFIDLLEKHGTAEAWRFAPTVIHVAHTETLPVVNLGGVVHTFTEVVEFGGGFNAVLNGILGLAPVPECVVDPGTSPLVPHPDVVIVPPGGHDHVTFEPGEAKKYLCCVHPWMRAVSR
jgi:hypothetical protein